MDYQPENVKQEVRNKIAYQPVWVFIVLSLTTLGLYRIYWFYRNWHQIRNRGVWDITPVWRALFSIFFAHRLLGRINARAVEKGHVGSDSDLFAAGYVITAVVLNFIARTLDDRSVIILLVASPAWFLVPAVKQLNFLALQKSPGSKRNYLTIGEAVVLVVSGLLVLTGFLGLVINDMLP